MGKATQISASVSFHDRLSAISSWPRETVSSTNFPIPPECRPLGLFSAFCFLAFARVSTIYVSRVSTRIHPLLCVSVVYTRGAKDTLADLCEESISCTSVGRRAGAFWAAWFPTSFHLFARWYSYQSVVVASGFHRFPSVYTVYTRGAKHTLST